MILASDSDTEIMARELARHGLVKYFAYRYISGSLKTYKPSDAFVGHLKKHASGGNCYFVGDSETDVKTAKKLGIKAVLVDRKPSHKTFGADFTIQDLSELVTLVDPPKGVL